MVHFSSVKIDTNIGSLSKIDTNNGLCVRNLSPAKRIKLCVPTPKSVCEIFFPCGQAPKNPVPCNVSELQFCY